MPADRRFAVLIDADNVSDKYIKIILDEVSTQGVANYKRIYGNWTSPTMASWKNVLLDYSVTPIQQYSYTTGKNATDSAMIIDAMDILYSGKVEGFCLVSSDSDFTRLASRLREGGMTVIGMGEKKTPKPFIAACNMFRYLDVLAAQPEAGQHILDACGAPGGKSFSTAIAIGDDGSILSCDIHPSKVKQIQKGAKRLGLASIQSQIRNAKEYDPSLDEQFDLVLADAPCSGLGIIRKKPDIRNKDPEPLKDLPRIQGDILENVSRYVKSGGVLVYSTCTVLERENQDVVRGFLAKHPEFTLEPFTLPDAIGTVEEGMLTLWPHIHGTDGFFLSKMRKQRT